MGVECGAIAVRGRKGSRIAWQTCAGRRENFVDAVFRRSVTKTGVSMAVCGTQSDKSIPVACSCQADRSHTAAVKVRCHYEVSRIGGLVVAPVIVSMMVIRL